MEGISADIAQLNKQFTKEQAAAIEANPVEWEALSKSQLKEAAAEYGLSTSGTKADLIARIKE